MLSTQEVDEAIARWYREKPYRWSDNKYDGLYDELYNNEPRQIENFGIRLVEQFGGEGLGDDAWLVFEVTEVGREPRLFRVDGYHQSYDGTYYDGDLYEVEAKQVQVIRYERVK